MAAHTSTFAFRCGLRGYHIYRKTWIPKKDEILFVKREEENPFDRYAIAAVKRDRNPGALTEKIVGHLPKEISRLVSYIILHGARVLVKMVEEAHRRSPLVQGGLEILILVTLSMDYSENNQAKIKKFEALFNDYYQEPVNKNFDDATIAILKTIHSDDEDELDDSTHEELDDSADDEEDDDELTDNK